MLQRARINMGNLLLSLSDALDLAAPSLAAHQLRTAYVGWMLAQAMGLSDERTERTFVAALLHDVGALTPEEKVSIHNLEMADPGLHCMRGETLFGDVAWLRGSARTVRHHHTAWATWTDPLDSDGFLEAQILHLADLLERSIGRDTYILYQDETLAGMVRGLAGNEVHADVVDAFQTLSRREEFWLDLVSPRLYSLLLHQGPFCDRAIGMDDLQSVGLLFRHLIDFRSRFTATHSSGVSACAAAVAQRYGFADHEVRSMEVAGHFHDLGKLAVPNAILEKPAGLTREEFAVIRQHPYWTFAVLNTIGGLDQIAEWAAFHHERLDGKGYPFHLPAERLSSGARILAVADIATALIEDRPYRPGMGKDRALDILRQQAGNGVLDRNAVTLLSDAYDEISVEVREKQAVTRAFYERAFVGV